MTKEITAGRLKTYGAMLITHKNRFQINHRQMATKVRVSQDVMTALVDMQPLGFAYQNDKQQHFWQGMVAVADENLRGNRVSIVGMDGAEDFVEL